MGSQYFDRLGEPLLLRVHCGCGWSSSSHWLITRDVEAAVLKHFSSRLQATDIELFRAAVDCTLPYGQPDGSPDTSVDSTSTTSSEYHTAPSANSSPSPSPMPGAYNFLSSGTASFSRGPSLPSVSATSVSYGQTPMRMAEGVLTRGYIGDTTMSVMEVPSRKLRQSSPHPNKFLRTTVRSSRDMGINNLSGRAVSRSITTAGGPF